MRRRDRYIVFSFFIVFTISIRANDGSYRGNGSNLVPINDSTVSVTKEILKFTRVGEAYVEVDVYYEFFNEDGAKEMTIGFEAMPPYGDVANSPKNGEHPYISNFTVKVNGEFLGYNVALVADSIYVQNGIIKEMSYQDPMLTEDMDYVDYIYVYHFNCKMKPGRNIIKHTYRQEMSNSVADEYSIDYVLTAANRWKGGRIDDFKIIVDMGNQQRYSLRKSFFQKSDDWNISGNGIVLTEELVDFLNSDWTTILIDSGTAVYHEFDFYPNKEFQLMCFRNWAIPLRFNSSSWELSENFNIVKLYPAPANDFSKKILKNYPFALRGYEFTNAKIQAYFDKQKWYIPNSNYLPSLESLSEEEQEWVLEWSK
jgi:hypothetical protein